MSDLLLDTHTILWFIQGDQRLSGTARSMIEDPSHRKFISIASCWEISIKVGTRKLDLGEPARPYLERAISRDLLELLPIRLEHATYVERLPDHHKDPFDRLLIAQAMIEGLPIVGIDPAFDAYQVRRIW